MSQIKLANKWFLLILVSTIALPSLQGCSGTPVRDWPAMEGVVLDADTNEPIEGAIVVAFWEGYGGHSKICFHTESGISDATGKFLISPWRNTSETQFVRYQTVKVGPVFKAGYRESPRTVAEQSHQQGTYFLAIDRSDTTERIEYLLESAKACTLYRDGSEMKAWPLLAEILRESIRIAKTKNDKTTTIRIVQTVSLLLDKEHKNFSYDEAIRYAHDKLRDER